jgi:Ca2+/Na+ antiporter
VSILAGCLCVFKCILYLCTVVYIFGRVCLMGVFYNCIYILHIVYILGTYEVRNEIETKSTKTERNENEMKRNQLKQNEMGFKFLRSEFRAQAPA